VIIFVRLLHRRSDVELLRAATSGDPDAFACCYGRYRDVVVAYLVRRTCQPEVALDLALEAFAGALLAVHREEFAAGHVLPGRSALSTQFAAQLPNLLAERRHLIL
jgi:DNA-directed RNA polymerase specialized sigma24 family protein